MLESRPLSTALPAVDAHDSRLPTRLRFVGDRAILLLRALADSRPKFLTAERRFEVCGAALASEESTFELRMPADTPRAMRLRPAGDAVGLSHTGPVVRSSSPVLLPASSAASKWAHAGVYRRFEVRRLDATDARWLSETNHTAR